MGVHGPESTPVCARVRISGRSASLFAVGLLFVVSAVAPARAQAAIAFVQGNYATPQSPQSVVSVAYTGAQTAGDLNVVVVGWNDSRAVVTSVTDTAGNSYTVAAGPTVQAGTATQTIYYAKNIAAAATNTVTVRFNTAAVYPDVRITEYGGIDKTSPVDVTAAQMGSGASSSSGAVTTKNANDLLFAANTVQTHSTGAGSGFTSRMITKPDGDIVEDRIVSAIGSYTGTAPVAGGAWIMQMVAFKAAGSAPPDTTPPSVPTGLTATAVSSSQINLAWNASTDNVGVTGYRVYRGGTQIASVSSTTYSDTGLTPSTTYSYTVAAFDAAGNVSAQSSPATATTLVASSSPGLVAAYSFNEGLGVTATDSSGNGNTGTLVGDVTWRTDGKFQGAISVGTETFVSAPPSYVTVPPSPSWNAATAQFTIEFWIRVKEIGDYKGAIAVGPWETATAYIYSYQHGWAYRIKTAGGPNGWWCDGNSAPLNYLTVVDNAWHHVALVMDAHAGQCQLFSDGTLIDTDNYVDGTTTFGAGNNLIIGGFDGSRTLRSDIDEVRLYNRALTPAQIAADMGSPIAGVTTPTLSQIGQWSGPYSWPIVAIHTVLLRTGVVLAWDDHTATPPLPQIWDPTTNTLTSAPAYTTANLFCSGHAALPDGRLLVTGGHIGDDVGVPDATAFDPVTRLWAAVATMAYARWYPTTTALPDGRELTLSGSINCETCRADVPEIYDSTTNTWTQLTNASLTMPLYPNTFVLPDGRVIVTGSQDQALATNALDLATQTWTVVDPNVVDGGSSVMFLPGKIMKSGTGRDPIFTPAASAATTYVLDMTQPAPAWQQTAPMAFARTQHNLTVLPDGSVLVTGGGTNSVADDLTAAVYDAELWSPATRTWTILPRMQTPRLYHSTALLLPDGRVLVGGGGHSGRAAGSDEFNVEIYSPPYLFRGPRPTISVAPATIHYGGSFSLTTPDASRIAAVSLVRPGAVTHAFNEDQRFVPLTYSAGSGTLTVQAPANGNLAPPGYYMVFIVDTNGVPSVGSFVRLGP